MNEILSITLLSLQVSAIATLISLLIGLPFGTWLALGNFRGSLIHLEYYQYGDGIAACGCWSGCCDHVMAFRSARKPASDLHTGCDHHRTDGYRRPCRDGLDRRGARSFDPRLQQQLLGLGASRGQMVWYLWREARLPLLAALMAGFGSVISEVGASMMVGGNIRGQTRVLTTAIVLETSKGEFGQALALSTLLLVLTYLINLALTWIQQKGAKVGHVDNVPHRKNL